MKPKPSAEQAMKKQIRDHDRKSDEHRHKATELRISLDQLQANQRLAAQQREDRNG